jgi:methyl-accepting chemotaxis protein
MGAEARSVRPFPGTPRRQLRNYLLDRRFQLKYTSMVVGVTLVVASILGALAYRESKGQTEALQVQLASQPDLDPRVADNLDAFGRERDRQILLGIIFGIGIITIALGITGIVITHKVVGPAFKMRKLFGVVSKGHLRVEGQLRKGDELKDVFSAFHDMVGQLRARKEQELARIEQVLRQAQASGGAPDVTEALSDIRDRIRAELD